MSISPISPIAPARVRAVLVPLGKIRKQKFDTFVERLREDYIVRLGDVSPDALAERTAFSPLAFPNGSILYDLSTTVPPLSHASLSPYETFREALVVLCLADVNEYTLRAQPSAGASPNGDTVDLDDLNNSVEVIKEQLPRALLIQPLLFGVNPALYPSHTFKDFITVPRLRDSYPTTIKSVMCDVSARFLAELSTYARSIQIAQSIRTPAGTMGTLPIGNARTPRPMSLLRTTSLRLDMGRSDSTRRRGSDGDINGLPELTEIESAPAEYAENQESQASSPRQSIGTPELRSSSPAPRARQVSRDSSVDSLTRREMDDGRKQAPNPRRSLLRNLPSPAEMAERRLRGRQTLVIGSLYLQAGRWADALRELSDGVLQAQSSDDHFWHAKGLENVLVTMLLLARGSMEFQIPEVCFAVSSKSVQKRSTSATVQLGASNVRSSLDASETLTRLGAVIPDLCRRILDIHVRGFSSTNEVLSRHAFSETIVRLARLLVYMRNASGELTPPLLSNIIFGTKTAAIKDSSMSISANFTKTYIADFLFRAFPPKAVPSPTTSADIAVVLAGMSSVLGELGLDRKQAMVNKELLAALILAISQAKRIDLSSFGLGIRPDKADGESDTSRPISMGTDANISALMDLTGRAYALVQHDRSHSSALASTGLAQDTINDAFQSAALQSYGSLRIKLEMLRLYSNVAEVIPDYAKVVSYAAAILEVIGPHSAPATKYRGKIRLPKDEQIRYITKIQGTIASLPDSAAARASGQYWDAFLVRQLELQSPLPQLCLLSRSLNKLDLDYHELRSAREGGPFLHDAFAKSTTDSVANVVLVNNEDVEFAVTLQNLYDFKILIESISLLSEGVDFIATTISTSLPPTALTRITLSGRPKAAGQLRILGCKVKVQGCHTDDFFLVEQSWSMSKDIKIKAMGVGTMPGPLSATPPDKKVRPQTRALSYEVYESQPTLSIVSSTFPTSTVSLLDGELRTFTVLVCNDSTDTDVDFVHLSFESSSISTKISSLSDVEQYEVAHQRIHRPDLAWKRKEGPTIIHPRKNAEYEVEVRGNAGLRECQILVDYAHLRGDLIETKKRFFTRQVKLPLAFDINPSIELVHHDFVQAPDLMSSFENTGQHSDTFLWNMTVRNSCERILHIFTKHDADTQNESSTAQMQVIEEIVHPGQTVRLSIVLPKIFVEDTSRPVPNLTGGPERQFVVDKTRRESAIELNGREMFWYREELLKQVTVEWKEQGGDKAGDIDLRSITLEPHMLEIIKKDMIKIRLELINSGHESRQNLHSVNVDEMLTLRVYLTNETQHDVKAYLHVNFNLHETVPELSEVDISNCLAWTGQLGRPLQTLRANQSMTLEYGLTALSQSQYVVNATVFEVAADDSIGTPIGHSSFGFCAFDTGN